ncbi:MAG TPA: MnmC family methyltransferase [Polyangiaceae bacterium]|nr:MnmC family methyltransferase [Polyangiaceae bacterium]
MQPFETVARARTPDGSELTLVRRGDEWVVRAGATTLMSSRQHDSEESLASVGLENRAGASRVLVGGLGLGFTLRAVLDRVTPAAHVTVSELVPELVAWNRSHLAPLHRAALDDARCHVAVGDVLELLKKSHAAFDVLLLDVDNGPVALTQDSNAKLYAAEGVRACYEALGAGGVLAVWSAGASPEYEARLRAAGFQVEVRRVAARRGAGARHVIFLATRD